jgi:aspartate kinase
MNVQVEKFGGSSFKERKDYRELARRYKARLHEQAGAKWVVVVSAFPGLTEEFRAISKEVNPTPEFEATDALLPLADCISAVLLRHACDAEGVKATTLLGYQHGIITDSNFSRARILRLDPTALEQALQDYDVVVVPGGPAIDTRGRPTWLGKNSSDLTAVAMAAALKLPKCSIYSDVDGVYTADPNQIADAKPMAKVSYEMAIGMSESGAKVIHHKAVRFAQQNNIKIECRLNRPPYSAGTCIGEPGSDTAVVSDLRSQVFLMPAREQLDRACEVLQALDIPVVALSLEDVHYCVVPGGFIQLEPIFLQNGIPCDKSDKNLLTVVTPDGQMRHQVVPSTLLVETAVAEAQKLAAAHRSAP